MSSEHHGRDGVGEAEARALAERACTEDGLVLIGSPEEHEFGWLFGCNSALYAQTGDVNHMIPGPGPIAVMRDGTVEKLGSQPPQLQIEQLRRRWRESHGD